MKRIRKVAVVSPSVMLSERSFNTEKWLAYLQQDLGLEVVLMPTALGGTKLETFQAGDKARDIMAAYADDSIDALLAVHGGASALRVLDGLNPRVGGRGRDGEVGGDLDVQVATTTGDLDGVVRSVFHDENREGDGGHDGFLLAVGDEDEHLVVGDGGWSRDADGAGEVVFFDDLGFPAVGGDGFHEGGIVAL